MTAPVAQLDRVVAFEAIGWGFESLRVRQNRPILPHQDRVFFLRALPALIGWGLLAGCACGPDRGPVLPLTEEAARRDLERMRSEPVRLERPVVVIGGYLDPDLGSGWLAREIRRLTGDSRVVSVNLFPSTSFDDCRRRIVHAVDAAFPGQDPGWTTEVDAIGVSMGGLAARYAALPPSAHSCGSPGGDRMALKVKRLYTISSPHQGARLADLPTLHPLQLAMRRGSRFYADLERFEREAGAGYPIVPYVQWGDSVVGIENAAPKGQACLWTSRGVCPLPHIAAVLDPRIQADIARRLRGEAPHAMERLEPRPEGRAKESGRKLLFL